MIYIAIFLLGILLVGNYSVSRNLLYPPVLFAGVWLISIIGLAISGDTLYPVSAETLLVFICGALFFSVGGLVVISSSANNRNKCISFNIMTEVRIHRFLDALLVFLLFGLPIYWFTITKNVDLSSQLFLVEQRVIAVEHTEYNPLGNFVIIATFLALFMNLADDGSFRRRWRFAVAILLALVYGGMTGTKGNAVTLLLTLAFTSFIRAGRINLKILGIVLSLAGIIFAIGLSLVNFAYMDLDISMDSMRLIAETMQNYWLGGLVAFERVVQTPESLLSNHHLNRFFLETANKFGADFYVPSIHPYFTSISDTQDANVYTIYFSYFKDFSWIGVGFGMSMLGLVLTWIYCIAIRGNTIAMMFYGMNASGILLSIQAEKIILNLNEYTKMIVFCCLLYYVVSRKGNLYSSDRDVGSV